MPIGRECLIECEVVLGPGVEPEHAVRWLQDLCGGQTHDILEGEIEVCEFWENEPSTPKRMALDTAREEGWALVLKAKEALLKAIHYPGTTRTHQQELLDVCTAIVYWERTAAS